MIAALVAGQGHTATERLSERELQVLSLMAQGLSNAAIGDRLYLSPRAVERDISTIFTKLDLTATDDHNRGSSGCPQLPGVHAAAVTPSGGAHAAAGGSRCATRPEPASEPWQGQWQPELQPGGPRRGLVLWYQVQPRWKAQHQRRGAVRRASSG